jgi:hypothetical protein
VAQHSTGLDRAPAPQRCRARCMRGATPTGSAYPPKDRPLHGPGPRGAGGRRGRNLFLTSPTPWCGCISGRVMLAIGGHRACRSSGCIYSRCSGPRLSRVAQRETNRNGNAPRTFVRADQKPIQASTCRVGAPRMGDAEAYARAEARGLVRVGHRARERCQRASKGLLAREQDVRIGGSKIVREGGVLEAAESRVHVVPRSSREVR